MQPAFVDFFWSAQPYSIYSGNTWNLKPRLVFLFLGTFTVFYSVTVAIVLGFKEIRNGFLLLYLSPERPVLRKKLNRILSLSGFGDWMMLYLIARNTDRVVFGQVNIQLRLAQSNNLLISPLQSSPCNPLSSSWAFQPLISVDCQLPMVGVRHPSGLDY